MDRRKFLKSLKAREILSKGYQVIVVYCLDYDNYYVDGLKIYAHPSCLRWIKAYFNEQHFWANQP